MQRPVAPSGSSSVGNWLRFAAFGGPAVGSAAVISAFLPPFTGGLLLGAGTTAVCGLLAFWVVQATGTAPIMAGELAEQWTAQELRPLGRSGWRLVNRFSLRRRDIDHVLVGRPGALAVETKWSAHPWQLDPPGSRLLDAVRQVRDNAADLTRWHPWKRLDVPVRPVVVLWGAGLTEWPDEAPAVVVDGVEVVAGHRAREWRNSLPQDRVLTDAQLADAWAALDEQARTRDQHDADALRVPPSVVTFYGRLLLALSGFAGGLLVSARVLDRPWWVTCPAAALALIAGRLLLRWGPARALAWGWLAAVVTVLLGLTVAAAASWIQSV